MSKTFLTRILDAKDSVSSKRLITLIIASHFVVASFAILFLVCYITLVLPKGILDVRLLASLEKILQYDFYIILSGLGIITSEGLLNIILNKGIPMPIEPTPPVEEEQPK